MKTTSKITTSICLAVTAFFVIAAQQGQAQSFSYYYFFNNDSSETNNSPEPSVQTEYIVETHHEVRDFSTNQVLGTFTEIEYSGPDYKEAKSMKSYWDIYLSGYPLYMGTVFQQLVSYTYKYATYEKYVNGYEFMTHVTLRTVESEANSTIEDTSETSTTDNSISTSLYSFSWGNFF